MIKKLKHRLRYHKLSRKQATLQNLLLTALVILLGVFGLRAYADVHSMEAAIEAWCEEMYFGEAEILSVLEYEEDGLTWKDVTIGKVMPNGDRYEAQLSLKQKNPWRWEYAHSAMWVTSPMEYDIGDGTPKDLKNTFIGFEEFDELHAFDNHTTPTVVSDGTVTEVKLIPTITVMARQAKEKGGVTYMREYGFSWYPETGEVKTMWYDRVLMDDGSEGTLWLSEERMVFIAETLRELMQLE